MGAWDTGPFDNDHAADFAHSVRECSSPEAVHDLFSMTFGAFMDLPDDAFASSLEEGYELPSIMEEVIASAAYVADAVTGEKDYTDTVYARGVDPKTNDVLPHVDVGQPPGPLVDQAILALTRSLRLMTRAAIGRAWTDYPGRILQTLVDVRP